MQDEFLNTVSYNRFLELMRSVSTMTIFAKKLVAKEFAQASILLIQRQ